MIIFDLKMTHSYNFERDFVVVVAELETLMKLTK